MVENLKEVNERFIEEATQSFLYALLWLGLGDNEESLDEHFNPSDFAPEAVEQARKDVVLFLNTAYAKIGPDAFDGLEGDGEYSQAERIGHDFALTRNRCGAGFWDRGIPHGDALTALCVAFGEVSAYVGDSGKVLIFPHREGGE